MFNQFSNLREDGDEGETTSKLAAAKAVNGEAKGMAKTKAVKANASGDAKSEKKIDPITAAAMDAAINAATSDQRKRIADAAEEVKRLFVAESYSGPFGLGDGLTMLHGVMGSAMGVANVTNAQLAGYLEKHLALELSVQRISSLRLTADFFPEDSRDKTGRFSFKMYEQARKNNQKKGKLEGTDLAAKMDTASEAELDELLGRNKAATQTQTLTIRVVMGSKAGDTPLAEFLDGGKKIVVDEGWMIDAAYAAVRQTITKFKLEHSKL